MITIFLTNSSNINTQIGIMTDTEYIKRLGLNIKRIRQEKGITQVELGYMCNFEKSNMQRIEAGKTNPTIKTLLKIAKSLKVSLTELINFK